MSSDYPVPHVGLTPWFGGGATVNAADHLRSRFAIAGGYTPIAFVSLGGWVRVAVLATAWGGAAIGIALHWLPNVSKVWRGASYMIVSWSALFVFPQLGLGSMSGVLAVARRWRVPHDRGGCIGYSLAEPVAASLRLPRCVPRAHRRRRDSRLRCGRLRRRPATMNRPSPTAHGAG